MKLRNRTAAFLAISALTLALAACSDNGDTTTTTQAPLGQEAAVVQVGGNDVDGQCTPVLESRDIDTANMGLEIADDNAQNAVVNRDGDKWTITGTGTYDDEDRTDEVHVEVMCPV